MIMAESGDFVGFCYRDWRNTLLSRDTAPADSAETFTVAQRTVCAVRP